MRTFYFLLGLIALTGFSSCSSVDSAALPIFGERQGVHDTVVNGEKRQDTVYHHIPNFSFTDQEAHPFTSATLSGKIYVADFFFTSCPSICPITQKNMLRLQNSLKPSKDFALVSFTVDPRHDSPAVMKRYAGKLGASLSNWYFIWGAQEQTYQLAQKGYFASAQEDKSAPGGYTHSGGFILVDPERRVRGIYNGTDSLEIKLLIKDIPRLAKEYHLAIELKEDVQAH